MNGKHRHLAAAVALVGAAAIGIDPTPAAARTHTSNDAREAARPYVDAADESAHTGPRPIDGAVADVLVRFQGRVCSGTPIAGTVYVVTAAHCVLTTTGEITQRTVVRDGVRYPAVAVLVDTAYFEHPSAELDAAVLIMAQVLPGPAARVGEALPATGELSLAGYQPLDTDGSLLRGKSVQDHPLPQGASGTQVGIEYGPAGCDVAAEALDVSPTRVMVPCGLIPGASGGGLYADEDGERVLVGILSSVTADLSANGIVPLASLHKLLQHPELYAHGFSSEQARHDRALRELT